MKKIVERVCSFYYGHRKKLLIMRNTVLILLISAFQVLATGSYSQTAQLNLNLKNATIKEVLTEIENQSEFYFLYNSELIDVTRKVDISVKNEKVKDILSRLFSDNEVNVSISDRHIVLTPVTEMSVQQQKTVSGKVTDSSNQPLPGVTVVVKGTTNGTVTNTDGNYIISNIPDNAVLQFSFVGMKTQEIAVGNNTIGNVMLEEESIGLEEVAVTAFGIKRDQKVLGYSSSKVTGEQLSSVGNTNVQNSLQGKTAGVQVKLNSGMPGRPAIVNIRGARSLTGNNEPLYVIDGLPVTGGGRTIDFNPADIESMDILKGPAASALYGIRASNGVIIITTKSGRNAVKEPTITFESQFSQEKISYLPEIQTEYSQGNNGVFDQNGLFAYGAKISSIGTYTNLRGEQEQAAGYNNTKDFFDRSGLTLNNNLELTQGGNFGNYSIGIGNSHQDGVVKNTGMDRTNFKFNGLFTPFKKLKTGVSFNYSDLKVNDLPDEQGNANYFFGVFCTPPSYNLKEKPFNEPGEPYRQVFYRAGQNNPYWVVENNYREAKTNRTFGNIFLEYEILTGLKANYRFGLDNYSTNTVVYQELGTGPGGRTNPPSGGFMSINDSKQNQINSNLFFTYDKKFGSDITLNAVVGNELFDSKNRTNFSSGSDFITGGWANLGNATKISASNFEYSQRIVGFYGNLNIGFKEYLFLNASGRNDFVSNMPEENRSFFYPSIGMSLILTDAFPVLKEALTFAKIRSTYAEVGQVGPLNVNNLGYVRTDPGFTFPYNGVTSFLPNSNSINPDLKPENTKSIEIGGELRFFNNRAGIDYTYFNSLSDGQILALPIPASTGASTEIRNAGKMRSSGHEVMLKLTPLKNQSWQWDFNVNYSRIRTIVEELPEGLDRLTLADANGGMVQIVAEVGQAYPSIYGRGYVRDPQSGKIVVNSVTGQSTTGMPLLSGDRKIQGTPNPDYEVNFLNSLRFKNLTLNFQVDWRQGGEFFSLLHAEARFRGEAAETLNREEQVVLDAVKGKIVNGQLVIEGNNDLPIYRANTYWSGSSMMNNIEAQLDDASFVRLRELSLAYDVNAQRLKGKLGLKGLSIFITGRNLFLITNAYVDPELNMTTVGGGVSSANSYGIEWFQQPQTRSLGAGLRLTW
jgi:TonB-linked SusC/RagA family outer membrane protein